MMRTVMTKDDLKTGMVIETRDGWRGVIIRKDGHKEPWACSLSTFMMLDVLDDNLICKRLLNEDTSENDIVKVYNPPALGFNCMLNPASETLIWERKEKKKLKVTMKQIREKFECDDIEIACEDEKAVDSN